jgi:CRP/FNR family nitrogen fixation transcriptional regulator
VRTEASLAFDTTTIVRRDVDVDRAIPAALSETDDHASLASIGTFAPFHRHRRFCCEGEPASYIYRVMDGLAEGYHLTSDGRRQILGFYAAGDLFGVEAGARYSMFVDALTEGRIQCIARSEIAKLMSSNSPVLPELWSCMALGMQRSQKHILRLGLPATERVAGFILDMCDRLSDGDECYLPMTRQEMGDHLGLTIETISRTLTHLRQSGIIEFSGCRDVTILDRKKLKRLAC